MRARQALSPRAEFALALALRSADGAPLGEVFAFLSGLYFRGKLAYARRFAPDSTYVITASAGLVPPDAPVRRADLRRHARVPIDASAGAFRRPLDRDVRRLRRALDPEREVVLLGSIATDKYVATLLE